MTLTWYDGGLKPPTPAEMAYAKGRQQLDDNGVLYVGTKGKMYHGSHGGMPSLLPSELHEDAAKVPKTIPRSPGHYEEWLAACKGGPKPMSNFDYAGPLTDILLLGVLALRMPYRRLHWDSLNMKVTNAPELSVCSHRVPQGLVFVAQEEPLRRGVGVFFVCACHGRAQLDVRREKR